MLLNSFSDSICNKRRFHRATQAERLCIAQHMQRSGLYQSVFYRNGKWIELVSAQRSRSAYPTLCCTGIWVSLRIKVLPLEPRPKLTEAIFLPFRTGTSTVAQMFGFFRAVVTALCAFLSCSLPLLLFFHICLFQQINDDDDDGVVNLVPSSQVSHAQCPPLFITR